MKIENIEKEQCVELTLLYKQEGYGTYSILGENKFFRGKSTICFEDRLFDNFKKSLVSLTPGEEAKINDFDSDAFILIEKENDLGHYKIIYQIGGTHQENFCKLVLNTDEIGIKNLII